MLTIEPISSKADFADVADLVREFTAWAFAQDPDAGTAPTFADLDRELAGLPGAYGPPGGCFLLARDAGDPVGCVAYKANGEATVELKRMYVRPSQRGKGTGQRLVSALLDEARRQNNTRVVLDSYHTMTGAHRIYRALGFKDVDPPEGFPAHYLGRVLFMELDLG